MIYVKAWGEDIGQPLEHKGIIKFKYSETNRNKIQIFACPNNSPLQKYT